MRALLFTPNANAINEVFVSDNNNGRAVSITPVDGVYNVLYYDVSIVDPNTSTTLDKRTFNTKQEALTFAETSLA